jgi:hypothetical protein
MLRFADQQVDVLRHNYVSDDHEAVALAHLFQHLQQEIAPVRRAQEWFPTVATPGDEVQIMVSVEAF